MSVVMITGGLGFLGPHITRELLRRGHDVVLLDIAVKSRGIEDIKEKITLVKGDVTEPTQLVEAVKDHGVEAVIHYAALLSTAAEANPHRAFRINFDGLWNVFEVARAMDLESVVFASSIAAYGPGIPETVKEDTYSIPQSLYGISKQLGEMLGLWFHSRYGIGFAALRYGTVLGPGRGNGGASAYCQLMIQKPSQGEPFVVNVPKYARIPVAFVDDIADATSTAFEKIKNLKTRIYNLASLMPSPTAEEIAFAVRTHIPDADITFKPDPLTTEIIESWPRNLDITRAQKELGWRPKHTSLEDLVGDFVATVRKYPNKYRI